jgi:hypothetical protein
VRVYKFLTTEYGLKSLRERRLKITQLDELNDPFELAPFDLSNRVLRRAVKMVSTHFENGRGMLCFSANWRDPVIWAHYADKHRGVCLGFEIPDNGELWRPVRYVSHRLKFPKISLTGNDTYITEQLLFTKYANWQYEEEIRFFAELKDEDNGKYYKDFDESLRLVEVIAGVRCRATKEAIQNELGEAERGIRLIKARAGFKRFEVVVDQRGFV